MLCPGCCYKLLSSKRLESSRKILRPSRRLLTSSVAFAVWGKSMSIVYEVLQQNELLVCAIS